MRKMRFIALLLAAILTIFCVAPMSAYATEIPEETTESTEASGVTRAPYTLHTELVDEYDANTVRVWLELDPAKAENVASFEVTLQVKDHDGSITPGRNVTFSFDEALEVAKLKDAQVNVEQQTILVTVVADQNLVQLSTDKHGAAINKLPIGILTIEKLDSIANIFKIDLSGNTGDLATVDIALNGKTAAETYGVDFEIPVDGAIYGEPVKFPLGIKIEGKGTVEAEAVEEGSMTEDGKYYEGAKVRLRATPAQGYRLVALTLIDERNAEHNVELGGDFTFTMSSVIGVKAKFEAVETTYKVSVGENASILGTTANAAQFKERTVATVMAKAPKGQKFSYWKNEKNAVVSYQSTYSFVVTSDITLTPVFDSEDAALPSVALNASGTILKFGTKYRLSYSGVCSIPTGYKLVKRGIILINQPVNAENQAELDAFVIGGEINGTKVATCAVAGTSSQFISNINNVAGGGQLRVARAFLTYADKDGNETTVYSSNVVALTTP